MSNSNTALRLALVGAGTFASSAHFSILSKLQETRQVIVKLVWSRSEKSAANLATKYGEDVMFASTESTRDHDSNYVVLSGIPPGSISTELSSALFTLQKYQDEIDAVILCVPIPQNAAFARGVLSLGIHVFCEKPLAHNLESAKDVLTYLSDLKEEGKPTPIYAIGENFRFETVFERVRSMLHSQEDNEVVNLTLSVQAPMPAGSRYAFGWRLNQLADAGILIDGFVHAVAGLRVVANSDVSSVCATCSRRAAHFEKGCDTATATFTFANGIPASVFVSYACAAFEWRLVVVGTKRDIIVERIKGKPGYNLTTRDSTDAITEEFFPFNGVDAEFEAFVKSCRSGELDERLSASEAFNDLATVHGMFESSEQTRVVTIPRPPKM